MSAIKLFSMLSLSLLAGFFPLSSAQSQQQCLYCTFRSPVVTPPRAGEICDSLFNAACLDANGQPNKVTPVNILPSTIVSNARDAGAIAMGYQSYAQGLSARARENGIELTLSNPNDAFNGGSTGIYGLARTRDMFKKEKECRQEVDRLVPTMTSVPILSQVYADFVRRTRGSYEPMMAQDLNLFLTTAQSYCNSSENLSTDRCRQIATYRREAVDIDRLPRNEQYRARSEALVSRFFENAYALDLSGFTPQEAESVPSMMQTWCDELARVSFIKLEGIHVDFSQSVNNTRNTVDSLFNGFYSEQTIAQAREIFADVRSDVEGIVRGLVRDPQVRGRILDGYSNISFAIPARPGNDAYKTIEGLQVLDRSRAPNAYNRDPATDVFRMLDDPALSGWRTDNADYWFESGTPSARFPERVRFQPSMFAMAANDPYSFVQVTGHELGHKIGPAISEANGH